MLKSILLRLYNILRLLYNVLVTLPRDIRGLSLMLKVESRIAQWEKQNITIGKRFRQIVNRHSNKPCFLFEETVWTFRQVEDFSNKIAHALVKRYNLKKGDAVSLFMENRPEYVCIWLGLSKAGVITALINTNLKAQALIHSITISKSKILIYGGELISSVDAVRDKLNETNIDYVVQGAANAKLSNPVDIELENLIKSEEDDFFEHNNEVSVKDTIIYIFTSGTTGLPKPAVIRHNRYLGAGSAFYEAASCTPEKDIIYVSLPLYHGNGGMIAVGAALVMGSTVAIRKKFSASNFWTDCKKFNCTAFIYVGEICRYLVNHPPSEKDRDHSVRVAFGNGLRANVWDEFRRRFGVRPVEFYAASEGNCTLVNMVSHRGACGFVPVLNRYMKALPLNVVKIDANMEPIRDEKGFCIPCEPGEPGVAVGLIGNTTKTAYSGYANNQKASDSKILHNVFRNGQKAFNSGDLMIMDEKGFVYFADRLGDTFRWRGENVSTVEIENIISSKLNATEVIVYGVQIPGQEGRAGMAVITRLDVDVKKIGEDLKSDCPAYARPIFLRLTNNIEHTGSFKAKKGTLVEEAYNVNIISDKLFYFDLKEQNYVPLTKEVYEGILNTTFKV